MSEPYADPCRFVRVGTGSVRDGEYPAACEISEDAVALCGVSSVSRDG